MVNIHNIRISDARKAQSVINAIGLQQIYKIIDTEGNVVLLTDAATAQLLRNDEIITYFPTTKDLESYRSVYHMDHFTSVISPHQLVTIFGGEEAAKTVIDTIPELPMRSRPPAQKTARERHTGPSFVEVVIERLRSRPNDGRKADGNRER